MRPSFVSLAVLAGCALSEAKVTCAEGLYIIVARGTDEPKGTGDFGSIANKIAKEVSGSTVVPLDYPATFTGPIYDESEEDGVKAMDSLVKNYRESCPNGKIAVLGYSQGGQVAMDVFCPAGRSKLFSTTPGLSTDVVKQSVVAIVVFGDPSHVVNATYDIGTSKQNGIFGRKDVNECEKNYGSIIQSYCDTGDIYCDAGDKQGVHAGYFAKYGDKVVDFVVGQYKKSSKSSSPPSTSSATSSTSSKSSKASGAATSATSTSSAAKTSNSTASAPGTEKSNVSSNLAPQVAFIFAASFAGGVLQMLL